MLLSVLNLVKFKNSELEVFDYSTIVFAWFLLDSKKDYSSDFFLENSEFDIANDYFLFLLIMSKLNTSYIILSFPVFESF
jgi:hypothetical protein